MKYHLQDLHHKSDSPFVVKKGEKRQLLTESVCLPAAVIKQQALDNNLRWMQQYAEVSQLLLLPHGKTTMTPALFQRQLAHGAWGISVATAYQAQIAAQAGVEHIFIANQLVGTANMAVIARLRQQYPATKVYCCIDSLQNAQQLSHFYYEHGQPMNVLIELGINGKRCGCRTLSQAQQLASAVAGLPGLHLVGVEFYEGVLHGSDAEPQIKEFIVQAIEFAHWLAQQQLLAAGMTLFTGAGTTWFDLVAGAVTTIALPAGMQAAIRPGCYITHDQGVYEQAQQALRQRDPFVMQITGKLLPALEILGYVQSVPEADLAVIGIGKRDISFDEGLPQPIAHFRHGKRLNTDLTTLHTRNIMDQHMMVSSSTPHSLQVGDIMAFSVSHPCLTFDKWRYLYLVDEDYMVVERMETFFG